MITREDKIWLSRLAALIVGSITAVIIGAFKTQIAVARVADILKFGQTGLSDYLRADGDETSVDEFPVSRRKL